MSMPSFYELPAHDSYTFLVAEEVKESSQQKMNSSSLNEFGIPSNIQIPAIVSNCSLMGLSLDNDDAAPAEDEDANTKKPACSINQNSVFPSKNNNKSKRSSPATAILDYLLEQQQLRDTAAEEQQQSNVNCVQPFPILSQDEEPCFDMAQAMEFLADDMAMKEAEIEQPLTKRRRTSAAILEQEVVFQDHQAQGDDDDDDSFMDTFERLRDENAKLRKMLGFTAQEALASVATDFASRDNSDTTSSVGNLDGNFFADAAKAEGWDMKTEETFSSSLKNTTGVAAVCDDRC